MGRASEKNWLNNGPAAVAVLHSSGCAMDLKALLAELEPAATSVVVWRVATELADETELYDVVQHAGFSLQPAKDEQALCAGSLYLVRSTHRVWFEGERLRVGVAQQRGPCSFSQVLRSLARVWGVRGIVMATATLDADDEEGLFAVTHAGGAVRAERTSSGSTARSHRPEPQAGPGAEAPDSARARASEKASIPAFRMPRLFSFRSAVLQQLREAAEGVVRRSAERDRVRVWVPACRTGGLVYAVAMLMRDSMERAGSSQKLQVFGTDHDEEALAVARAGRYPVQAALGMDPGLRGKYTFDEGDTIRAAEALREACVFSSHKLMRNAPFARIDLIVCQRVFDGVPSSRRDEVAEEFYFSLRADGALFALDHRQHLEGHRFELAAEGYLRPRKGKAQRRPAQRWALPSPPEPAHIHYVAEPAPRPSDDLVRAIGAPLLLLDDKFTVLQLSDEAVQTFAVSRRDVGVPFALLVPRLPGGNELLRAAQRALLTSRTRDLTVDVGERKYAVRVSAQHRGGARGVAILFTDVSEFAVAVDRALAEQREQAALRRVAELALSSATAGEVYEDALGLLFGNIPACTAGLIVEALGDTPRLSVVASRGLGDDPLGTLQSSAEPFEWLQAGLGKTLGGSPPPVQTFAVRATPAAPEERTTPQACPETSPHLAAALVCPLLNEGRTLGVITLYSRQAWPAEGEPRFFLQAMAELVGGAMSMRRSRRGLALELDISSLVACASDVTQLGQGMTRALRKAVAAEAVELWAPSSEAPSGWRRVFPEASLAVSAPWGNAPNLGLAPLYREPTADQPGELWLAVSSQAEPLAIVRALGRFLRAPDRELSGALQHSGPLLAAFLEREQVLRASEECRRRLGAELEALYASLPVGISIHDETGAVRRMAGQFAARHVPVQSAAELRVARLYATEMPSWVRRVLTTGEPVEDLVMNGVDADQPHSWLCNISSIRDAEGCVLGAMSVLRETTLSEQLEANVRKLDRRREGFRALFGNELENPLAAMRNAVEFLRRADAASAQLPHLHQLLERRGAQTSKLLDGLLDLSQIDRDEIELDSVPLPIGEILRDLVEERRHEFADRRLELSLPDTEHWMRASRVRLIQVVDNLLSNALRFTLPGGLVRVGVEIEAAGSRGSISVSDNGVGIDPVLLPNIFDSVRQHQRLPKSTRRELGLGLAVVKKVIELHGFELAAYSDGMNRGTRFEISFPTTAPVRIAPASYIGARRLRLLVVSGDAPSAERLGEGLRAAGHEVEVTSSAEAALPLLGVLRPDVILCELELPGMDGLAFAERVRESQELTSTQLVALTRSTEALMRERIRDAGFDRQLLAPAELEAVRQCLAELPPPSARPSPHAVARSDRAHEHG
jgi:signal transduction histidine kinase/chemotaxis methyl-accepting protein methylase/CheY-like chemotaxis protein